MRALRNYSVYQRHIYNFSYTVINYSVILVLFMTKSLFLNSINEFMITRRYAKRTIESYIYWIKRFIIFSDKQHPAKIGDQEVERYLTYLANHENVAPGTPGRDHEIYFIAKV